MASNRLKIGDVVTITIMGVDMPAKIIAINETDAKIEFCARPGQKLTKWIALDSLD